MNENRKMEKQQLKVALQKFRLKPWQRIVMLLCNYIPPLHAVSVICTFCVPWAAFHWRIVTGTAVLYLLPPLVARCAMMVLPSEEGRIQVPSRGYFTWWFLLNLQILFCRLPFLESLLMLVPCAYSAWLRLWGSRIGRFTYWAPGVQVLDRGFLDIGDGVAFGAGVKLNPHVVVENDEGRLELLLGRIIVGHRAIIGGYSLLTAGTRIEDDESTRACLISPPFSHWREGRRLKSGQYHGHFGESVP